MSDPKTNIARPRIKVFVDYWNFQLGFNGAEERQQKDVVARVKINWKDVGLILAAEAASLTKNDSFSYEGTIIYTSFNNKNPDGARFRNWIENFLGRQAGVHVNCLERKPKHPPKCPDCHKQILECPHCNVLMKSTMEKGVDTFIVTDMIRLAWENAYEIAVLVSSDRDFIPGVSFLSQKGLKVVQVGFPPKGSDLAKASWATIDAYQLKSKIVRN